MKLIGSHTSPFVRKISVILLEKGIPFEFIKDNPYQPENQTSHYNPLGKIPALVTDEGEYWFDSPIIAEYIELLNVAPALSPVDPLARLKIRQTEALADGIMDAALFSVRERLRPAEQQSESELVRQREKINRGLDALEQHIARGQLDATPLSVAAIAVACAIGYLNFRRVCPGWCVDRPHLVKFVEQLFNRESFIQTEPVNAP